MGSLRLSRHVCGKLVYSSARISPNNKLFGHLEHVTEVPISRLSTSNPLFRHVFKLNLTKSNANRQKSKHIQFTEDSIQQKIEEYDLGVRRLAVIMGEDPHAFQETDVQDAIQYLFPSDLTSKQALPQLKHPRDVFPPKTVIKTDADGRPSHYLFYTMHGDFYDLMHRIHAKRLEVQAMDDRLYRINKQRVAQKDEQDPEFVQHLEKSVWISKDRLEKDELSGLAITDDEYKQFTTQMERLVEEPSSHKAKDFISRFRDRIFLQQSTDDMPEIHTDEDGRSYVLTSAKRKTFVAHVKLIFPGSGRIHVNEKPMNEYFFVMENRSTVISPFVLLGYTRAFDVRARVVVPEQLSLRRGATDPDYQRRRFELIRSSQAGAVRLALARALRAFVDPQQAEQLRCAGLLTPDPRNRERKKPGQFKARKKFTWKKR